MGEDLGADDGLDHVDQGLAGVDPEHPRRAHLAAGQGQQGLRVVEVQRQPVEAALEGLVPVGLGDAAVGQGFAGEVVDGLVDLGAQEVEDRRVEGVLHEQVALLAVEVELLRGQSGHRWSPSSFLRATYTPLKRAILRPSRRTSTSSSSRPRPARRSAPKRSHSSAAGDGHQAS